MGTDDDDGKPIVDKKRGIGDDPDKDEPAPKKTSFECYLERLAARKKKVKELLPVYNSERAENQPEVNIDRFMKIYDDETIPDMWCERQSKVRVMEVHPRTKRAIGRKILDLHELVDNPDPVQQQQYKPAITEIFRRIARMINTSSPAGEYDIFNYGHDPTTYEEGDDPALLGWANPPDTPTPSSPPPPSGKNEGGAKRKSKRNSSKRANKKKKTIKSKSKRRLRTRKY